MKVRNILYFFMDFSLIMLLIKLFDIAKELINNKETITFGMVLCVLMILVCFVLLLIRFKILINIYKGDKEE